MTRQLGTIALALSIAIFTAACSSNDSNGGGAGQSASAGGGQGTMGGGAGGSVPIVAQNFAFEPNDVSVAPGAVTLTVTNKDSAEHTFTLDDGSSSTNLDPGATVTIELTLTKTVAWHCKIHPSMTGTLEVAGS